MDIQDLIGWPLVYIFIALFIIVTIFLGVRIVPQSEKHVVERFGRLRLVLGPGINLVVPFLDRIAHKVSVLERQLPTASHHVERWMPSHNAITAAAFTNSKSPRINTQRT